MTTGALKLKVAKVQFQQIRFLEILAEVTMKITQHSETKQTLNEFSGDVLWLILITNWLLVKM